VNELSAQEQFLVLCVGAVLLIQDRPRNNDNTNDDGSKTNLEKSDFENIDGKEVVVVAEVWHETLQQQEYVKVLDNWHTYAFFYRNPPDL
jgi:hypothetical protein